jgi:hippurate hydrolase
VSEERNFDHSPEDILSRIRSYQEDLIRLRRDIHAHPELAFDEHRTASRLATLLGQWGYEVNTGVGRTGLVASLTNGTSNRSIGLRADMDALPMTETTGLGYASIHEGRAHACGHDGHMAMLAGAARYLSETRFFDGTVRLIFQPAEETVEGAAAMIRDGLFHRFPVDAVFGMHAMPELPVGTMGFRDGPAMASADRWHVALTGVGGHGAMPEKAIDPVVAGASLVMALQTVVSRSVSPHRPTVLTIGSFQSGDADNVIPREATIRLSIRTTEPESRTRVLEKVRAIIAGQAACYGVDYRIDELGSVPVLVNDPGLTAFARRVAAGLFGEARIVERSLMMASEDFASMLRERPGCMCYIGCRGEAGLHNPAFDFNDDNLVTGAAFWAALVERFLVR